MKRTSTVPAAGAPGTAAADVGSPGDGAAADTGAAGAAGPDVDAAGGAHPNSESNSTKATQASAKNRPGPNLWQGELDR